jgi:Na+-transporting NADH:ubiquinone oxidoreductase subunit NqrB
MFTSEHRRAVVSVALALQGALILIGAVLVGFNGALSAPLDNIVGAEASVAAIVLGAAFILAFRTPNRTWVNLAIMYEALAIVAQLWKNNGFTMRPTWTTTVVSGIFLIAFVAFYPTTDSMEMRPAH